MTTHPKPRFTLHPINPSLDYPTLTTISLSAFTSNPLHYLTFRSSIPFSDISAYHRATRIELPSVQTFKIIDNFPDEQSDRKDEEDEEGKEKIVAFASWLFDSSWPEGRVADVKRPEGMDMRFLNDFKAKVAEVKRELGDLGDCIELHLMRVLPTYQGKGLGSLLLKWRLEEARKQKRKVFLSASPQGRGLYSKFGFKVIGEVKMRIRDYLDEGEWISWCKEREGLSVEEREKKGIYVQSFMVWDPNE